MSIYMYTYVYACVYVSVSLSSILEQIYQTHCCLSAQLVCVCVCAVTVVVPLLRLSALTDLSFSLSELIQLRQRACAVLDCLH